MNVVFLAQNVAGGPMTITITSTGPQAVEAEFEEWETSTCSQVYNLWKDGKIVSLLEQTPSILKFIGRILLGTILGLAIGIVIFALMVAGAILSLSLAIR